MNALLTELYRRISSAADVQRLADEKHPEDLYLEFKEKHDRRDDQLHDNDRRGFAQALSGFANADGGVLLYGVATKKHGGSIDKADEIKPIANAERFGGRLKSYILAATSPPVDSMSVEFIPATGTDGFVKCLVLPSDRPPHMAMPDRQYYRRSIDYFRSMDHFELEDMFGRRPRPALQLHVTLQPTLPERLWFGMKNEGRSIAKYAGFHCAISDDSISKLETAHGLHDWSRVNSGRHAVGYAEAVQVIHPNGIVAFCGEAAIFRGRLGEPLPVVISIYAEGIETLRLEYSLLPGTTTLFDKAGGRTA